MSGYNYRKFRKLEPGEQWERVRKRVHVNDIEIAMAISMDISPKSVLSMNSSEKWKDCPALRIRRLYDERHPNPALTEYWEHKEGKGASSYRKASLNKQ